MATSLCPCGKTAGFCVDLVTSIVMSFEFVICGVCAYGVISLSVRRTLRLSCWCAPPFDSYAGAEDCVPDHSHHRYCASYGFYAFAVTHAPRAHRPRPLISGG